MLVKLPSGNWVNPDHVRAVYIGPYGIRVVWGEQEYDEDGNLKDDNSFDEEVPCLDGKVDGKAKDLCLEEIAAIINCDTKRIAEIDKIYEQGCDEKPCDIPENESNQSNSQIL